MIVFGVSTKSQAPNLFLTGSGITNKFPCLPQAGMSKIRNSKRNRFGHLTLVFRNFLGFGIWNLGFTEGVSEDA